MINEEKQDAEKDERQLAKRIEDRQGGECVRYKESRAEKQLVDADPKLGEKESGKNNRNTQKEEIEKEGNE